MTNTASSPSKRPRSMNPTSNITKKRKIAHEEISEYLVHENETVMVLKTTEEAKKVVIPDIYGNEGHEDDCCASGECGHDHDHDHEHGDDCCGPAECGEECAHDHDHDHEHHHHDHEHSHDDEEEESYKIKNGDEEEQNDEVDPDMPALEKVEENKENKEGVPQMPLLDNLIAPLTPQSFIENIHKRQCLVTEGHDFSELEPLTNVEFGLSETPSEKIHAWIPNKSNDESQKLQSVPVDENAALVLWNNHAASALYFRAPKELEDYMCEEISTALGMSFAQTYLDGERRGEIETFHSRAGHKTDWHFDFQHNFTFQLKGTKRWFLRRDDRMVDPVRGSTPHYVDSSNYDEQMKVNRMLDPKFERQPKDLETNPDYPVREIVLEAGSALYFPAGMWHKVVCEEDSVSINVSLTSASWGDVVSMAFDQLLKADDGWRSSICGVYSQEDAHKQLAPLLETLPEIIAKIKTSTVAPPVLFSEEDNDTEENEIPDAGSKTFVRNPLAMFFPAEEQRNPEEDLQVNIHINFGNSELKSLIHNTLTLPSNMAPLIEFLSSRTEPFTREILSKELGVETSTEELDHYLFHLQFFGLITEKTD